MNPLTIAARRERPPAKVVYFATGSMAEVAADWERLQLGCNAARVCVVAPADVARELGRLASSQCRTLLRYRPLAAPLLWLRLLVFLGFSRDAAVVCLSGQRRFRFLKFLALTLRGRVVFSPTEGDRVPLGPWDLARIWIRQRLDAREEKRKSLPIGVVGSASGFYLCKIVPSLRARYPHAPLHALLPPAAAASAMPCFDSVRICRPGWMGTARELFRLQGARPAYQRWIVPLTNEPYGSVKLLAFVWPLARRQIYNELGDGFSVRKVGTLWGHLRWRLRDRLSYQIVAGAAGRNVPVRLLHLTLYAGRLLGAVPVLARARLRALRGTRSPALRRVGGVGPSVSGERTHDRKMEAGPPDRSRRNPAVADSPGQAGGAGGPG